jgi:Cys-rich four helix bundle protein (predicted Tat secretion target)
MDRRSVLTGLTALAAGAATARAGAATEGEHAHHGAMHHHHHSSPDRALLDATAGCLNAGEICLAHCIDLLSTGDTGMAECARNVNQMLAVCGALHALAAQESRHVPALARLAGVTCKECMEACRKHADRHQQCRDCMNSCEACARECARLAA